MKKKQKIIKSIIVISIVLIILLIILNNAEFLEKILNKHEYENIPPSDYQQFMESTKNLKFKNISVLQNLQGELPVSSVTTKLKDVFCEKIPKIIEDTKSLSEIEIDNYYKENEISIRVNLRIDNIESFRNMLEKFNKISSDLNEDYDYIEFSKDGSIFAKIVYINEDKIEFELKGKNANNISLEF